MNINLIKKNGQKKLKKETHTYDGRCVNHLIDDHVCVAQRRKYHKKSINLVI